MRIPKLAVIVLTLCFLALNLHVARAEMFVDLYVGGSFSTDDDISVSALGEKITTQAEFDSSLAIGYRMGYWLDNFPLVGFAFEVSHFEQNTDNSDLSIIPVSALVMFQIPLLKKTGCPMGELLPYVGIGPGIFFSSIKYEVANSSVPDLLGRANLSGKYSDRNEKIGLDVRAGIAKMFPKNRSIFCEYRYTHVSPDFEVNVLGTKVNTEVKLNTHYILLGFSYHF